MKAPALVELENEVDSLQNELAKKQDELFKMRIKIITEFFETDTRGHIEIGDWKCEDSPIGICFYDSWEDPAWDDCLICGNPDERK
jgi:hypothetical protein